MHINEASRATLELNQTETPGIIGLFPSWVGGSSSINESYDGGRLGTKKEPHEIKEM
jgi:hypothetical protein